VDIYLRELELRGINLILGEPFVKKLSEFLREIYEE